MKKIKNPATLNLIISISLISIVIFGLIWQFTLMIGSAVGESYDGDKEKKEEIISFYHENKDLIRKSIQNKKYEELKKKGVLSVYDDDSNIRFDCDGEGIVPAGIDYGFFYSKNNNPDSFYYGSDNYKKHATRSGYYYEDLDGDNDCYVEKIEDDYYYFEHFW